MKRILLRCLVGAAVAIAAPFAISATDQQKAASDMPPPGSVSKDDGLKAWQRIQAVVTHPRCANCHVGADNVPRWNVVGESKTRLHGMNINAGFGRAGIPGQACTTCHVTSTAPNDIPHAPPHVGIAWQLAPVQFQWFGKSGAEICQQLRDPKRNGGRDAAGLAEHLRHDAFMHGFIPWSWNPGGGRSTPPGTFESHVKDVAMWGAAGQPCPE